jgi:CubicO group peptidase (beta-lactamase class C family)
MCLSRVTSRVSLAFLLSATLVSPGLYAQATLTAPAPIALAKPESVGFSSAALAKMDEGMQAIVDKKHLSGVVTLVARHGKVVQHKAYGYQDLESRTPMTRDTIARIYSMTKPVTGVAMMMLYEEGKWKPTDPISKHIPSSRA